ncbi:MAG: hypothetical protein AAGF28_10540 [Pseudomonadota bacterium]
MGEAEFFWFSAISTLVVVVTFGWLFFNMVRLFMAKQVHDDDRFEVRMGQMMGVIRPPMTFLFCAGVPCFLYFVVRSGLYF